MFDKLNKYWVYFHLGAYFGSTLEKNENIYFWWLAFDNIQKQTCKRWKYLINIKPIDCPCPELERNEIVCKHFLIVLSDNLSYNIQYWNKFESITAYIEWITTMRKSNCIFLKLSIVFFANFSKSRNLCCGAVGETCIFATYFKF